MKKVHKKLLTLVAHMVNDLGESETTEDFGELFSSMGANPDEVAEAILLCNILEDNASEASCSPEEHNEPEWNEAHEKLVTLLAKVTELGEDEVNVFLEDNGVSFPYEQWESGLEDKSDEEDDDDSNDEDEETDEEE